MVGCCWRYTVGRVLWSRSYFFKQLQSCLRGRLAQAWHVEILSNAKTISNEFKAFVLESNLDETYFSQITAKYGDYRQKFSHQWKCRDLRLTTKPMLLAGSFVHGRNDKSYEMWRFYKLRFLEAGACEVYRMEQQLRYTRSYSTSLRYYHVKSA